MVHLSFDNQTADEPGSHARASLRAGQSFAPVVIEFFDLIVVCRCGIRGLFLLGFPVERIESILNSLDRVSRFRRRASLPDR
jgi:hypothetical protein